MRGVYTLDKTTLRLKTLHFSAESFADQMLLELLNKTIEQGGTIEITPNGEEATLVKYTRKDSEEQG